MKKYCNNCKKETERYKSGHCVDCVNKRSTASNKKLSLITSNKRRYANATRKETFKCDSYKPLTISSVIKDIRDNKSCFIYFLTNNKNLVYVGKSNNNVLARINSHLDDKVFDEVFYVALTSEKLMDEYEKRFIIKYKPKYNSILCYTDAKIEVLDRKTLEVKLMSAEDMMELTGASLSSVRGLFTGTRKSLYGRYVLNINRTLADEWKNVLDTHTGKIERHSLISFAEMVGVNQNNIWAFFNGACKTYRKKRYVIVD